MKNVTQYQQQKLSCYNYFFQSMVVNMCTRVASGRSPVYLPLPCLLPWIVAEWLHAADQCIQLFLLQWVVGRVSARLQFSTSHCSYFRGIVADCAFQVRHFSLSLFRGFYSESTSNFVCSRTLYLKDTGWYCLGCRSASVTRHHLHVGMRDMISRVVELTHQISECPGRTEGNISQGLMQ